MFFRAMSYDKLYKQDAALPESGTDGDVDMSEKFDMAKIDVRFRSALAELEELERMKAATQEGGKFRQELEKSMSECISELRFLTEQLRKARAETEERIRRLEAERDLLRENNEIVEKYLKKGSTF